MTNQNSKRIIFIFFILILIFAFLFLIWRQRDGSESKNEVWDSFARCLTDKGIVMYGAYWCPHCQNEKAAFGDSFKYVDYVECTRETKRCLDAKIEGYPTWIFSDGRRLAGEQGIEKLAAESGCVLPSTEY